jgi:hypothetical protein
MSASQYQPDRNRLWRKLADDFRQACLFRREGRSAEADEILERRLPETIGAWSRLSGLSEPDCRERLSALFDAEQKRVDDVWLAQQIILRQMQEVLIPSLCLQVAEEVREVMEQRMEQVNEALGRLAASSARSSRPMVEREVAPGIAPTVRLSPVAPPECRAQPNFDDLPAIIDELVSQEIHNATHNINARAAVLV